MGKVVSFKNKQDLSDERLEHDLRRGLSGHGFSESAIESALSVAMPLFKESRTVVAQGVGFELPGDIGDSQVVQIQEAASRSLQEYQASVASLILSLIVKVAIAEAHRVQGS
jgi:hypothetical protein